LRGRTIARGCQVPSKIPPRDVAQLHLTRSVLRHHPLIEGVASGLAGAAAVRTKLGANDAKATPFARLLRSNSRFNALFRPRARCYGGGLAEGDSP